jgi:carbon-monoxide dehydrogenase medium subunit
MWEMYCTPTTIDDVLCLLAEHGASARIIAGGTDLLIELRRGIRTVSVLVDVTRIKGLDRAWLDEEGWVYLGPTVTHNQVVASCVLRAHALPLAQACWQVGTPALRNRGTVVGNLVTASPANDTITALLALDAKVSLRSARGERTIPLADLYKGVRKVAMGHDEMMTGVRFRAMAEHQRGTFVKLGLRRTHAIALVNAAVVLTFDEDTVADARIALGSVAPTVVRAVEAEKGLIGHTLSDERILQTAGLAARAASPINDIRSGADYRREMVRLLVRRALTVLGGREEGADGTGSAAVEIPADPPMLWGTSDGHYPALGKEGLRHRAQCADPIACTVNGRPALVHGAADKTLLQMLRDDLALTGTKEGCAEGECGACTVWMNGIAVLACLVAAPRAHGSQIVTVEGLSVGGALHPVQQAFIDEGAVQCGYCTPGFVMAGANLLQENPHPTPAQIRAGLSGNLCRCTGYYKIVQAIERAATGMKAAR